MDSLREKIADAICRSVGKDETYEDAADAVLAIPEIKDALSYRLIHGLVEGVGQRLGR